MKFLTKVPDCSNWIMSNGRELFQNKILPIKHFLNIFNIEAIIRCSYKAAPLANFSAFYRFFEYQVFDYVR